MQYTRSNAHGMVARWAILFCCMTVLLFATNGMSQIAGTGNIQGTVTDSTGAVIPNAPVTLTDQATHVKHTTKSNSAGAYVFPGVPIGKYDLGVAAPGFKTYEQTGIVLEVGSNIGVDVASAGWQCGREGRGAGRRVSRCRQKMPHSSKRLTRMP
jgi:hypothetical protein